MHRIMNLLSFNAAALREVLLSERIGGNDGLVINLLLNLNNPKKPVEATQVEHKPYGQWISKVSKTPPNR